MFGHERFEAYQIAIKFVEIALQLVGSLPAGNRELKDQLRRASISIALNIAEGTGKTQIPDRLKYYAIARGSAMECAAICDVIALVDRHLTAKTTDAKALLKSVVAILTKICGKSD